MQIWRISSRSLAKKIEAAKLVVNDGGLGISGISLDALNAVTVASGSRLNLDFEIKDTNIKMSWIFKSDSYDIGFSMSHSGKEVVAKRRANGGVVHEGYFVCPEVGKYTVTFDNTYSLFRSKTLHYLITVEDAKYDSVIIENTH